MPNSDHFSALVDDFSRLPQVDAILLAGSRGAGRADPDSDYDVYIYLNDALPVSERKAITDRHCQSMELNNQFWETEDDGVLKNGVEIDLIYRGLDWLEGELSRVIEQHQARVGYTTCFWANLLDSKILFDREGKADELQRRFDVDYPHPLKQAIVSKCFPLMMARIPAYYHQLKKAIKLDDRVSVNHRLAEMLAAYFDMLFAVNEIPHPGEKRLLELLESKGELLPQGMREDVTRLLQLAPEGGDALLATVERMTERLQTLLRHEKLLAE